MLVKTHNVTWDISNVPKQISNGFSIRLRSDGLITPCTFHIYHIIWCFS
jgi:hypothetical protein